MKSRRLAPFGCFLVAAAVGSAQAPDEDRLAQAVLEYAGRIDEATREFATTRVEISGQRAPLMDEIRAAEEQIALLEADLARLTVERAGAEGATQAVRTAQVSLDRNLSYVANVVLDGFKAYEGHLLPGEETNLGPEGAALRKRIEEATHPHDAAAAVESLDLFLTRLQRQLGGYTTPGTALVPGDNLIHTGTLAFLGPEVYFQSESGDIFGTVRSRRDSPHVLTHPIESWTRSQADALMRGDASAAPIDVSSGKALRLLETRGSLWAELQKGGGVGYVIMALGVVAIAMVLMKVADLRRLDIDSPVAMAPVLRSVAAGDPSGVRAGLSRLRHTTRELVETGLRHADGPRTLLEEQLEGLVLRHRLHLERRLPLLAVIATSGPLLGLLGTVTGMIKTFNLITVFGTGSAGRLSGGISEALVATALGLAVAIPTLVVHGFLSHRIHKSLALLERYSLEFVTAVEESRQAGALVEK